MEKLRIALIGCGGMGMGLGRSLNALEAARIAVCCDIDEARALQFLDFFALDSR